MGQEVDRRTDIFAVGIILWELLAGQRLFLGETDFQTVKKVQQAARAAHLAASTRRSRRTSSASSPSRSRAIPTQRYRTARELGQDLVEVHVPARPAGEHVRHRDARAGRDEGAAARPPDRRRVIIDKLIEEALLEFTSLTDDDKKAAAAQRGSPSRCRCSVAARVQGAAPGPREATSTSARGSTRSPWARSEDDALRASLPPGLAEGNLAALEEEPASAPNMRAAIAAPQPAPAAAVSAPAPVPSPRRSRPRPRRSRLAVSQLPGEKKSSAATMGVVVALLVVMAAGAAAWFTHLIPHP